MPQIQLKQYYSGRMTNEQLIAPGTYEVGDPRLYGLEAYLVDEQGIAVFIGGRPSAAGTFTPPPSELTAPLSIPPLPQMDFAQLDTELLRTLVAVHNPPLTPTGDNGLATREDLIQALRAKTGMSAPETDESGVSETPQTPTPAETPSEGVSPYAVLKTPDLRKLIEERGLKSTVKPTGKNGAVKDADYRLALENADKAAAEKAE